MTEPRAPRGTEWSEVMEVLGAVANMITVRAHYQLNHPAILQAEAHAAASFTSVLERIPDLVVALVDGEFIVCERPLPELRRRLHALADAMKRHEIECIVFQQGVTHEECGYLGSALASPADGSGRVREQTQGYLAHVLLRFVVRSGDTAGGIGASSSYFLPAVRDALVGVARALATDAPVDKLGILAVANQMVLACSSRVAMIEQRSWTRSIEDEATHAANVATLTALMMLDAGYAQRLCVDAAAAALVHDVGHLFVPEEIRGIPEPLLDERAIPVFRNHTFAGASLLLGAGCPPLWIAAALEHHRGVDGKGYPTLGSSEAPHEIVQMIALANFYDRKRTLLNGSADAPDEALRAAMELEERYFGRGLVRRFLRAAGAFPPGTTVELTSLEPAIVMRSNATDPWRPQVKILRGPRTGKLVELRDTHPTEARYRLSIVRAIPPPMLVLADVAVAAPVVAPTIVRNEVALPPAPRARPNVEAAARGAASRARASLGGMDDLLDALLTVPSDVLVTAMPQVAAAAPAAYAPAPVVPAVAPGPVSPAPPPVQVVVAPVAVAPAPVAPVAVAPAPPAPAAVPKYVPPPLYVPPPSRVARAPSSPDLSARAPSSPDLSARAPSSPDLSAPAKYVPPPLYVPPPPPRVARAPSSPDLSARAASSPDLTAPAKYVPPPLYVPPPPRVARAPSSPDLSAPPAIVPAMEDPHAAERALLAALGSGAAVPRLVGDVTRLSLDHRAAFVLRFMDGASSIDDILDASGLPRIDALRALKDLLARGVIAI